MIKNLYKLLAVLGTVISLSAAFSNASAQTIFTDNFSSAADSAGSPGLPTGWTTTGGYKKWVFTNYNKDATAPVPVDFAFVADANPGHGTVYGVSLDTAAVLTSPDLFAGKTVSSYKKITVLWVEMVSPKWWNNLSGSAQDSETVEYSIDGKTWDSIAFTRNLAGPNLYGYTNNGSALSLPNAVGAAHLWMRWRAYPYVAKGAYSFTDLTVTGSTSTGINETIYNSNNNVNAFYSNNNLHVNINSNNNGIAQMAIYSADGKQVLASVLNANEDVLVNLSSLSAGAYIAKFTFNGEVYNTKFVK